jgi:hypothetical protein
MTGRREADDAPAAFREAQASLRAAAIRPEVVLDEVPAPSRLAPFAMALTAEVVAETGEQATGRFVLLHEPLGQEAWQGTFRVVSYVRAELELELAADPLLLGVGWTWLTDALDGRRAAYAAAGGTVTRVSSESFGGMSGRPATAEIEIRASWTPLEPALGAHVEAWADLLCSSAGLPPLPAGVVPMPPRRPSRGR